MTMFKLFSFLAVVLGVTAFMTLSSLAQERPIPADADNFYTSDKVTKQRVSFPNQYRMNIVGTLITPKDMDQNKKYPAIIVGHPMGAVKEQSSALYATKMAEQGFVTLAVDLAFWGESDGQPRNAVSTEMYSETFSAAVDYLGTRSFIDRKNIGVIGICGSGSFAISAAKIDSRLKAVATVSMYDMGAAARHALRNSLTLEQRKQIIADAAEQRYVEFQGGPTKYTGGTVHELTPNSHPIEISFMISIALRAANSLPPALTLI